MIANRFYKKLPIGQDQERHVVRLETYDCPATGTESKLCRIGLLKQIAEHPEITDCGGEQFQKLTISYNGKSWVAEAETILSKPKV